MGELVEAQYTDKWQLLAISQWCCQQVPDGLGLGGTEPRLSFNAQINTADDAIKVLTTLASTFWGQVYWGPGGLMATADMPAQDGDRKKLVVAANTIDAHIEYTETALKTQHSIVAVTWNDPANFCLPAVETVENRDRIARFGRRIKTVVKQGCTSRGEAHRFGLWILETEASDEQAAWSASWDQADFLPGEIAYLSDRTMSGLRMGGRLAGVLTFGNGVVLDVPVTIESGKTYTVSVVMPNGTIDDRVVTTAASTTDTLHFAEALSDAPIAGAVWALTSTTLAPRPYKVVSRGESARNIFPIVAQQHDPTKYGRIDALKLHPAPALPALPTGALAPPSGLTFLEGQAFNNGLVRDEVVISWVSAPDPRVVSYQVQSKPPIGEFQDVPGAITRATSVDIWDLTAGSYDFRVRSLDVAGNPSPSWAILTGQTVVGLDNAVPLPILKNVLTGAVDYALLDGANKQGQDLAYAAAAALASVNIDYIALSTPARGLLTAMVRPYDLLQGQGEATITALLNAKAVQDALTEAGITIDSAGGRVTIWALNQFKDQYHTDQTSAALTIDGINASINLRATSTDLTNAVSQIASGLAPAYNWQFNLLGNWTGTNCTPTLGALTTTVSIASSGAYLAISGISFAATNNVVRVRMRQLAGSGWNVALKWGASFANSQAFTAPSDPTQWTILSISIADPTWIGTLTALRLTLGTSNADLFEIDYITVGTATFDPTVISGLTARVTTVEIGLSAANGTIATLATQTVVNGISTTLSSVQTTLNAATSTISTLATQTSVTALGTTVTSVQNDLNAITGAISQNIDTTRETQQTQNVADAAILNAMAGQQARDLLVSSVGNASQSLSSKIDDQGNVLSAYIARVVAQVGTNQASVLQQFTATASQIASEATARLQLAALVGDAATLPGGYSSVISLADATASFVNNPTLGLTSRASASDVTQLRADVGTSSAGFIHTTNLAVTAVNDPTTGLSTRASVSSVSSLSVQINDPSTGLIHITNTQASAISIIDGKLLNQYTLSLDTNGFVSGLVALNDGSTASFIIITDVFEIASPSHGAAGTRKSVFTIAPVNGIDVLVFIGTMFADSIITNRMVVPGTLTADRIEANSITTTQLSANCITSAQIAAGAITSTKISAGAINVGTLVADDIIVTGHLHAGAATAIGYTQSINVLFGGGGIGGGPAIVTWLSFAVAVGPVDIIVNFQVNGAGYNGSQAAFTADLLIDGVSVRSWTFFSSFVVSPNTWRFASVETLAFETSVSPGTHTFAVRISDSGNALAGSGSSIIAPNIRVLESRR